MSNPYRDRLLGVGLISASRTGLVREGRTESGRRYKIVRDELNATIRESSAPGATGVSDRQDVHIRPKVVEGPL